MTLLVQYDHTLYSDRLILGDETNIPFRSKKFFFSTHQTTAGIVGGDSLVEEDGVALIDAVEAVILKIANEPSAVEILSIMNKLKPGLIMAGCDFVAVITKVTGTVQSWCGDQKNGIKKVDPHTPHVYGNAKEYAAAWIRYQQMKNQTPDIEAIYERTDKIYTLNDGCLDIITPDELNLPAQLKEND